MRFSTPLVPGRLIRRYKRFLADVRLDSGAEVIAHCANPGSMLGLAAPGTRVWLEPNDDPGRKLRYGWRLVDHDNGHFTGVDTSAANKIVAEALAGGLIPHDTRRAEVAYGDNSRVDFLLEGPQGRLWLEVKSVTMSRHPGLAEFPDSVTARGTRHLGCLADRVAAGDRAMLLFLVQRTDCTRVALAADIDPAYARAMTAARAIGVTVAAYDCNITPHGITLRAPLALQV